MDPAFPLAHSFLGELYACQGRYADAETEFKTGVSFRQEEPGLVYALAGRREDALRAIQQLEQRAEREYVSPARLGLIWVALGEKERGYALLNESCAARSSAMRSLKVNPIYDFMRADPQFKSLLKCLNLE
jgi:hypothetical protein